MYIYVNGNFTDDQCHQTCTVCVAWLPEYRNESHQETMDELIYLVKNGRQELISGYIVHKHDALYLSID